MAQSLSTIVRHMRGLFCPERADGVSDTQLLERFLTQRDEAAFELLVWRHGPMVLSACARVLSDPHDIEDAFQATFLTLVRKAGSIGRRGAVGSWLYKVAYRIALRARAARRTRREVPLGDAAVPEPSYRAAEDLFWRELRPVLDAEVHRLPEKYRAAFVLCYLEGKTNQEAAEELGCPKGTVLSRLARARQRLRAALTRRGLSLASEPFAEVLAQNARALATVSPVLVQAAVHAALLAHLGKLTAGGASSGAAELAEGVLREMRWGWRGLVAALLLAGAVAAAAAGTLFTPGSPLRSLFTDGPAPGGGSCH